MNVNDIYKHTKSGKLYKIVCLAKHSETLEDLVVYEALYDNLTSKIWVRPAAMFLGTILINGEMMLRFQKL